MNNSLLNALVLLVVGIGIAAAAGAGFAWHNEDLTFMVSMVALTVASELLDFGPFANNRISVSVVLIFAAATFSGLPGGVLIASVAAATDALAHPKAVRKVAFNFGALAATGAAFAGVLEAFSSTYDSHDWLALLGPAMLGAAAGYAVNSGFVSLAISLDKHEQLFAVWSERFRWMFPHYVFVGVLAVVMALSYDRWEVGGLALFLVPLAMVWLTIRQYLQATPRTRTLPSGT